MMNYSVPLFETLVVVFFVIAVVIFLIKGFGNDE